MRYRTLLICIQWQAETVSLVLLWAMSLVCVTGAASKWVCQATSPFLYAIITYVAETQHPHPPSIHIHPAPKTHTRYLTSMHHGILSTLVRTMKFASNKICTYNFLASDDTCKQQIHVHIRNMLIISMLADAMATWFNFTMSTVYGDISWHYRGYTE